MINIIENKIGLFFSLFSIIKQHFYSIFSKIVCLLAFEWIKRSEVPNKLFTFFFIRSKERPKRFFETIWQLLPFVLRIYL
jgi:hypothetical protein